MSFYNTLVDWLGFRGSVSTRCTDSAASADSSVLVRPVQDSQELAWLGGDFHIDQWRIHSYPERDLVTLVHPDFYPVRLSGAKAHEVFEELTQLFRGDGFSAEEVWQWFIAHNLEF